MNEHDRLPMLVEMGRVPAYPPPAFALTDEEPEEGKFPLSQYLWILKRYRWRIGGFIAAAVMNFIVVALALFVVRPMRRSISAAENREAVGQPAE